MRKYNTDTLVLKKNQYFHILSSNDTSGPYNVEERLNVIKIFIFKRYEHDPDDINLDILNKRIRNNIHLNLKNYII